MAQGRLQGPKLDKNTHTAPLRGYLPCIHHLDFQPSLAYISPEPHPPGVEPSSQHKPRASKNHHHLSPTLFREEPQRGNHASPTSLSPGHPQER
ncbi:hypothetical protein B0T14DRAFT_308310 [Immersiella caudata]|uniref:Uncharacterized protein n=1 Tax=Immersiella caudata TaxID=314043 RepID=A0AA39WFD4_9PEZI|nr:hypothetical protein B0T14DRAFT_308310 [Immersiella caudata]